MALAWKRWQAPAYPGRLIAAGQTSGGEAQVIVYLITGRSQASQARKIVEDKPGTLRTEVTDPQLLSQGNRELLLYDCVKRFQDHLLISNGAQTRILEAAASRQLQARGNLSALSILSDAHLSPHWTPDDQPGRFIDLTDAEPDPPHWTPRISAVVGPKEAAMSIVKRIDDATCRHFFSLSMSPGILNVLTTYAGDLAPGAALPSFLGEPRRLTLPGDSPQQVTEAFCEAFGPRDATEQQDLRVSVVTMFYYPAERRLETSLWNRHSLPPS